MKKLLLIPLLFLAYASFAQLPVVRGPDGVTVEDYRAYFLKNFRLPVFSDTTAANVAKGLDSVGTMISIRGTDTVYIRAQSLGAFHKWTPISGTGGGGGGTDTIFVTPIGTAAGMIQTLYAVDGNLRVSNWGPGYGTLPFLAGDSLAYIDIDTTSVAYKAWVIAQFGPGGPMASGWDDVLSQNQNQTQNRIINIGHHNLSIDSANSIQLLVNNPSNTNDADIQLGDSTVTLQAIGDPGAGTIFSKIVVTPSQVLLQPQGFTSALPGYVWTMIDPADAQGHWAAPTGGGSGTDSASFHDITQVNDSTFTLNRPNGTSDTVQISVTGGGGGSGNHITSQTYIRSLAANTVSASLMDIVWANTITNQPIKVEFSGYWTSTAATTNYTLTGSHYFGSIGYGWSFVIASGTEQQGSFKVTFSVNPDAITGTYINYETEYSRDDGIGATILKTINTTNDAARANLGNHQLIAVTTPPGLALFNCMMVVTLADPSL